MNKVIFTFVAFILLMTMACKKKNSTNLGGSWIFKSATYQVTTCNHTQSNLTAVAPQGGTPVNGGTLTVDFYNSLPTDSGSFIVVNGRDSLSAANQIGIHIIDQSGKIY